MPFQLRTFDLWVVDKVVSLITEAGTYRISPLRAFALLNFADPGGADNAEASEALNGNEVLSYLDCPIGRRKAFSHAAAEGRGVRELKRQDPKASTEIAAMVAAVFDNVEAISKR